MKPHGRRAADEAAAPPPFGLYGIDIGLLVFRSRFVSFVSIGCYSFVLVFVLIFLFSFLFLFVFLFSSLIFVCIYIYILIMILICFFCSFIMLLFFGICNIICIVSVYMLIYRLHYPHQCRHYVCTAPQLYVDDRAVCHNSFFMCACFEGTHVPLVAYIAFDFVIRGMYCATFRSRSHVQAKSAAACISSSPYGLPFFLI